MIRLVLQSVELRLLIEFALFALPTIYLLGITLCWRLVDLHELRLQLRPLVTIGLIDNVGSDCTLELIVQHIFASLVLCIVVRTASMLHSASK